MSIFLQSEGAFRQLIKRNKQQFNETDLLRVEFRKMEEFIQTYDRNCFNSDLQTFIIAQRREQPTFLTKVSISYQDLLKQLQEKTKVSTAYEIASFWLRCFSLMICEVGRVSKRMNNQVEQPKSIRKKWSRQELQALKNLLENNNMEPDALQRLSLKFGRSIASIQSKIRKMQKVRKSNEKDSYTLQKKLINILKQFPDGLTKQQVFGELVKRYEMDEDNNWKKSAGQLLCSSKSIEKTKGTYGLMKERNVSFLQANSIKEKTVFCLMKAENHRATLKQLADIYIHYFQHDDSFDQVRQKAIISNLGRVVARYPCFDRSQVKTKYRYNEEKNSAESDEAQLQFDS